MARENSSRPVVSEDDQKDIDKIRDIANIKDGIVEDKSLNSIMGGNFSDPWMARKESSTVKDDTTVTEEASVKDDTTDTTVTEEASVKDDTTVTEEASVKDDTTVSEN